MPETAKLRLDACAGQSDRLEARACRGACHRFCGRPRQNSARVAVHEASAAVVFAVADGESGAAEACHAAVEHLLSLLPQDRPLDFDSVAYHVTERLAQLATYVTTLVAGVVQPDVYGPYVQLFRIGDSGAWLLDRATGACHALFEPLPHAFEAVEAVESVEAVVEHLTAGEALLVAISPIVPTTACCADPRFACR